MENNNMNTNVSALPNVALSLEPDTNTISVTPVSSTEDTLSIELSKLSPQEKSQVEEFSKKIDITNSNIVLQFGSNAQTALSGFSDTLLNNVRAKDSGYVGDILTDLMLKVKDMNVGELEENKGFLSKVPFLGNLKHSAEKFIARYDKLEAQINTIINKLEDSKVELLQDIGNFDALYKKNIEYFRALNLYIIAGEIKLKEINDKDLPELEKLANISKDPMDAQKVSDMRQLINRFEKKLYDLKLSRMIAVQSAPQIRLVQNNNQLLVEKIQSSLVNTIPLWKNQIVIAIGIMREKNALAVQKQVSDTTNELLLKNSQLLKQNTIEIAKESERGIVDIDTLKQVNVNLISTIDETLRIQQEGKIKRQEAEKELVRLEVELKNKLSNASNR